MIDIWAIQLFMVTATYAETAGNISSRRVKVSHIQAGVTGVTVAHHSGDNLKAALTCP